MVASFAIFNMIFSSTSKKTELKYANFEIIS